MRNAFLLLILPVLALAAPTQPSYTLTGTLATPLKITRVAAVDRAFADVLKTSAADPKDSFLYNAALGKDNAFHVDNLLPNRSYDLIVWTAAPDGTTTRWEGVNMDYCRPITPAAPATDEDRKAIAALITDVPQFYDKCRPLKIAADHQHATVLVELVRTRDFHSDKGGEVIYRVELWYFENLFGGWAKDANTEKVIARARGNPKDLPQNWQFLAQLGNLPAVPATTSAPASQPGLALPDKPDPKYGLAGGIK